jgi:hypothetical protein
VHHVDGRRKSKEWVVPESAVGMVDADDRSARDSESLIRHDGMCRLSLQSRRLLRYARNRLTRTSAEGKR